MSFFGNRSIDFDKIQSVVILKQTQLYKGKSNWGLSFGSTLGDSHVIAMDGGNVPAGAEKNSASPIKTVSRKSSKQS